MRLRHSKEAGGRKSSSGGKNSPKKRKPSGLVWAAVLVGGLAIVSGIYNADSCCPGKKKTVQPPQKTACQKVIKPPELACGDKVCVLEEGEISSKHYCDKDCNPAKKRFEYRDKKGNNATQESLCGNGKQERNSKVVRKRVVWNPPKLRRRRKKQDTYLETQEDVSYTEVNPGQEIMITTAGRGKNRVLRRKLEGGQSHMFYDSNGRLNIVHACSKDLPEKQKRKKHAARSGGKRPRKHHCEDPQTTWGKVGKCLKRYYTQKFCQGKTGPIIVEAHVYSDGTVLATDKDNSRKKLLPRCKLKALPEPRPKCIISKKFTLQCAGSN